MICRKKYVYCVHKLRIRSHNLICQDVLLIRSFVLLNHGHFVINSSFTLNQNEENNIELATIY